MSQKLDLFNALFIDQDFDTENWLVKASSPAEAMRNMLADCIRGREDDIMKLETVEQIEAFAAERNVHIQVTRVEQDEAALDVAIQSAPQSHHASGLELVD